MSEADRHHEASLIAGELQACLDLFRPRGARLGSVYDHVVESDLLGILVGKALAERMELTRTEWHRLWQEAADEMVPGYVDVEYSEAELREVRIRIAHAMMSLELVDQGREALLEEFEEKVVEG